MFFNNNKGTNDILNALDKIESYISGDTNAIGDIECDCSGDNLLIANKVKQIAQHLESKQTEEIRIFGEIMLLAEKLSDGFVGERVTATTTDPKLKYISKTLNVMSEKLEKNLIAIDDALNEYSEQNYLNDINTSLFRGGSLKHLGGGINMLRESITKTLLTSHRSSLVIEKESATLLDNITVLTDSTIQQAAAIEETAAAVEEITGNIASNTKTAIDMSNYGNQVKDSISSGLELANKTVESMNEINTSTNAVQDAITVIDQIAFQTNILSLNAAVEAATAGEAGKGFAVVAQEVRNLAGRSAEAAKEIKDLVDAATSQANNGKAIADDMISGYQSLNENITETITRIENVVGASKEQELGIAMINNSINEIDEAVQKNTHVADLSRHISVQMTNVAVKNVAVTNKSQFHGKDTIFIRESNYSINGRNKKSNYTGPERRHDF